MRGDPDQRVEPEYSERELYSRYEILLENYKKTIAIEAPHPRKPAFMTSEKFTRLRNQLYSLLHDEIRKAVMQSTASERAAVGGRGSGKGAAS